MDYLPPLTIRQISEKMGISIDQILDMPLSGEVTLHNDVREKIHTCSRDGYGNGWKEQYIAQSTITFQLSITKQFDPQFYGQTDNH